MTKVHKRGAELMVGGGLVAYGVWAYYSLTIVLLFGLAAVLVGLAGYNVLGNGALWVRSEKGRRSERRMLLIGGGLALTAVFVLGTGRHTLGQIGAQLLVIVGLLAITASMLGFGSGSKKKD